MGHAGFCPSTVGMDPAIRSLNSDLGFMASRFYDTWSKGPELVPNHAAWASNQRMPERNDIHTFINRVHACMYVCLLVCMFVCM